MCEQHFNATVSHLLYRTGWHPEITLALSVAIDSPSSDIGAGTQVRTTPRGAMVTVSAKLFSADQTAAKCHHFRPPKAKRAPERGGAAGRSTGAAVWERAAPVWGYAGPAPVCGGGKVKYAGPAPGTAEHGKGR